LGKLQKLRSLYDILSLFSYLWSAKFICLFQFFSSFTLFNILYFLCFPMQNMVDFVGSTTWPLRFQQSCSIQKCMPKNWFYYVRFCSPIFSFAAAAGYYYTMQLVRLHDTWLKDLRYF
jgi:hypothetical protein